MLGKEDDIKSKFTGSRYREVPWWIIAAIVFTLLYVLNPFDLIPDAIPLLGQLDDVAVMVLCLKLIDSEVQKYKKWKARENGIVDVKVEEA